MVLTGLQNLLDFYLPALLSLGIKVRRLYWEGRMGGAVHGNVAKVVLEQCLALHIQLLGDWECKAEYTRSLSVALLQWQPAYSRLPGCCFVEEACEAMLSRMVGRCRANAQLSSFQDVLRLFVTLPLPSSQPKGTRGGVRLPLVFLMTQRMQSLVQMPGTMPFARVQTGRQAVWETQYPADFRFPDVFADATHMGDGIEKVLKAAMVTLSGAGAVPDGVRAFLDTHVTGAVSPTEAATRQGALHRINQWASELRQRQPARRTPSRRQPSGTTHAMSSVRQPSRDTTAQGASSSSQSVGTVQPPSPFASATQQTTAPPQSTAAQPSSPAASDGGSLYEPPPTDDAASAGFESFGDTDSLGSVGQLVEGADANWGTLEDEGLVDYQFDPPPEGMPLPHDRRIHHLKGGFALVFDKSKTPGEFKWQWFVNKKQDLSPPFNQN